MTIIGLRRRAALLALHIMVFGVLAAPAPALAMQILEAADHAELTAQISATGINRIALAGDRIAKVVRSPDGFSVEHDAASGDLYLRPAAAPPGAAEAAPDRGPGQAQFEPVTLFVGTEKGFTYRLTLKLTDRDSAQILIRNAEALPGAAVAEPIAGDPHVAALVRLVGAAARRDLLPGYAVQAGGGTLSSGIQIIETWRGSRLAALVFEAARPAPEGADGVAGLAGTIRRLLGVGPTADGARLAALWLAPPATGPSGGRLGVAVVETAGAGDMK